MSVVVWHLLYKYCHFPPPHTHIYIYMCVCVCVCVCLSVCVCFVTITAFIYFILLKFSQLLHTRTHSHTHTHVLRISIPVEIRSIVIGCKLFTKIRRNVSVYVKFQKLKDILRILAFISVLFQIIGSWISRTDNLAMWTDGRAERAKWLR